MRAYAFYDTQSGDMHGPELAHSWEEAAYNLSLTEIEQAGLGDCTVTPEHFEIYEIPLVEIVR